MTHDLYAERQATLVATALIHSVTTAKAVATLPKTAPEESLHWKHLTTTTGCIPSYVTITTIQTNHSPLTRDTEDTLTSHDYTTDPVMPEVLATTEETHPTLHPTTIAVSTILQLTDTTDNTPARTHHTGITTTHLDHATFPTGVTLEVIPQTKAYLVQAILTIPLKDHTQRKL